MTEIESRTVVRRFFDEVFNRQSGEAARELIAPDFVAHHPAFPGGIRGPEGILESVAGFRAGFPDLEYRVEALVADGEMVAARWAATGTHRGTFLGVPATGRAVTVPGIDLFRLEGGRLAEAWVSSDFLGLMQQIGAVPAPPPPPA